MPQRRHGAKFLDDLRYYDAITCLQRIWTRDRLINHQRLAQETFVNRLQVVRDKPGQEYLVTVKPKTTKDVTLGALKIETDSTIPKYQRQLAFFSIYNKPAETPKAP